MGEWNCRLCHQVGHLKSMDIINDYHALMQVNVLNIKNKA